MHTYRQSASRSDRLSALEVLGRFPKRGLVNIPEHRLAVARTTRLDRPLVLFDDQVSRAYPGSSKKGERRTLSRNLISRTNAFTSTRSDPINGPSVLFSKCHNHGPAKRKKGKQGDGARTEQKRRGMSSRKWRTYQD